MPNYVPFDQSQIAARPLDMLSGLDTGDRDMMTQAAQRNDLQSQLIQNQTQQQALDLARARQPNLISQSNLEGATARATTPGVMAQGNMGFAQTQAAAGQKAQALVQSDIQAGKFKNASDSATYQFNQHQTELTQMYQLYQQMERAGPPGSPQSQSTYMQLVQGLPPEVKSQMPQSYSLQAKAALQRVLTETPAMLNELKKIEATGTQEKAVAGIHAKATEYAADTAAGASKYAAEQNVNPQKEMARTYSKIAAGDTSQGTLDEARRNTAQYISDSINKSTGAAMMMAAIEKGPEAIQNTISALNRLKENEYDRVAHPLIRGDNPFRGKNRQPGAPVKSNTGIPGVNKVE